MSTFVSNIMKRIKNANLVVLILGVVAAIILVGAGVAGAIILTNQGDGQSLESSQTQDADKEVAVTDMDAEAAEAEDEEVTTDPGAEGTEPESEKEVAAESPNNTPSGSSNGAPKKSGSGGGSSKTPSGSDSLNDLGYETVKKAVYSTHYSGSNDVRKIVVEAAPLGRYDRAQVEGSGVYWSDSDRVQIYETDFVPVTIKFESRVAGKARFGLWGTNVLRRAGSDVLAPVSGQYWTGSMFGDKQLNLELYGIIPAASLSTARVVASFWTTPADGGPDYNESLVFRWSGGKLVLEP
jgi:hypothetical protein